MKATATALVVSILSFTLHCQVLQPTPKYMDLPLLVLRLFLEISLINVPTRGQSIVRFPRDLGVNIISHLLFCFCQLSKAMRQVSLATSSFGDCPYVSEGELSERKQAVTTGGLNKSKKREMGILFSVHLFPALFS